VKTARRQSGVSDGDEGGGGDGGGGDGHGGGGGDGDGGKGDGGDAGGGGSGGGVHVEHLHGIGGKAAREAGDGRQAQENDVERRGQMPEEACPQGPRADGDMMEKA